MSAYGAYLHSRVKAWKDLKHDLVAVQTESNRRSNGLGAGCELRLTQYSATRSRLTDISESTSFETLAGGQRPAEGGQASANSPECSDTMQGESRLHVPADWDQFYDDDLRDENTVLAFRMLVKDLLVLFQAGNEGVCNILGKCELHRLGSHVNEA